MPEEYSIFLTPQQRASVRKHDDGTTQDPMESPALNKSVIKMLYNDKADRYEQPALTAYLNKFIAYVHQNDTYGLNMQTNKGSL